MKRKIGRPFTNALVGLAAAASLFVLFTQAMPARCASPTSSASPKSPVLQGTVVQNEVADELEKLGIKCKVQQGANYALIIDSVRLGSAALNAGLDTGDVIKNIVQTQNKLQITVDRAGHIYQCVIDESAMKPLSADAVKNFLKGFVNGGSSKAKLINEKPVVANVSPVKWPVLEVSPQRPPVLDVNPSDTPVVPVDQSGALTIEKILKQYNIELIIDISGSMQEVDGTDGLTKFEWCHRQVRELANRLGIYRKLINITTFNDAHTTYFNCDPDKVEGIYANTIPARNTNLVEPLMERLEEAFSKGRRSNSPSIVAVITDGLPNIPKDPKVVNAALIDFSGQLSSQGDMTVTMLQIGDTFDGRDFCVDLDENLVKEGAKYDFVETKTFSELKGIGLAQALIDAVSREKSKIARIRPNAETLLKKSDASYKIPPNGIYRRPINAWDKVNNSPIQPSPALIKERQERSELEKQILGQ